MRLLLVDKKIGGQNLKSNQTNNYWIHTNEKNGQRIEQQMIQPKHISFFNSILGARTSVKKSDLEKYSHDETEDITTDVTRPALPCLPLLIDRHGGTSIVVPRAAGNEIATLRLQFKRRTDDIYNVNRATHTLFQVEVLSWGQTTTPLKVTAESCKRRAVPP